MIDIDHFKNFNDSYGHQTGDNILRTMTGAIQSTLDKECIFSRLGGEEFAILIEDITLEEACQQAELIRAQVEKEHIKTDKGIEVSCTVSIGVAIKDDSISTLDDILKLADAMLYKAKGTGRNRTIFR